MAENILTEEELYSPSETLNSLYEGPLVPWIKC